MLYATLVASDNRAVCFSRWILLGGEVASVTKSAGFGNSSKLFPKRNKCAKSVREMPYQYFLEVAHRYASIPVLCVALYRQILGGWVFAVDVTNAAAASVTQSACGLFLFYNLGPLCDLGLRLAGIGK